MCARSASSPGSTTCSSAFIRRVVRAISSASRRTESSSAATSSRLSSTRFESLGDRHRFGRSSLRGCSRGWSAPARPPPSRSPRSELRRRCGFARQLYVALAASAAEAAVPALRPRSRRRGSGRHRPRRGRARPSTPGPTPRDAGTRAPGRSAAPSAGRAPVRRARSAPAGRASSLRVALTCSITKPQALSVGRSRSASPSSLVDSPINVDEGHHGHRGGRDTITERRWLRRVGPGGSTLGEASVRRHDEHGHRS